MTESSSEKEAINFLQLWAESLQEVLAQIAGAPCQAQLSNSAETFPEAPKADSDLNFLITANGVARGEMNARVPAKAALAFGQLLLVEEQNGEAEFSSDHRQATLELFRQIAGRAATKITSAFGETPLRVEMGPPPTWSVAAHTWMSSASDSKIAFQLEWQLSSALVASFAAASQKVAVPSISNVPAASTPSESNVAAANLNLFKDVELDVTMRFGGRRMLLREILELGPGSVIELDRQVQEPVDLLLDGKIIARGEVVVVEGNFGLRVLEVTPSG